MTGCLAEVSIASNAAFHHGSPSRRIYLDGVLLDAFCAERIAAIDLARFQAGHKPARALLRRAVGKGIGDDVALRLPL